MRSVFTARPVAMARVPLTAVTNAPAPGLLAEGVFLASRSLDGCVLTSSAAAARTAYALRAATRTTPSSVWCATGVAVLDGPDKAPIRWCEHYRTLTLPAADWLLAVADRLLEEALPRLTVFGNNLALRRGDRWEAVIPGPDGENVLGSVAATDLSDWLLGVQSVCAGSTGAPELLTRIQDRYPGAGESKARTALVHLIRTGLLLTDLLPDDLRDDPLRHLVQRLPRQHPWSALLTELRGALSRADGHQPGSVLRRELLREARALADDLHRVERPLTVDTVMDGDAHLPACLGVRAAEAASVLWRIGHRTGPLETWTRRFTDLYGRARLVPLLEAVDPVAGVGPPGPEDAIGAGRVLEDSRARHMVGLYTDALARGLPEIALTDDDIRQLCAPDGAMPPRTAEIHVRPVSQADGTFMLVVGSHAAQDAGSAGARLGHLLPGLLSGAEPGDPDLPVSAEIVCRPLTARSAALTASSGTLAHRIPIGVPARDGDVQPADLAVASSGDRLIVWSRRMSAPVRPVLLSRITRDRLPPAAQLLYLLGHAGERPWHPFTWTRALPYSSYTPRVTFRGTVLAPQRWTLPGTLVRAAARRAAWAAQLDEWIAEVRPCVPDAVLAEESDRHLLVDLADAEHREILRRSVVAGTRTLAEAIGYTSTGAPVDGPDGRHLLELVVPLVCLPPHPAPAKLRARTAIRPRRSDLTSARDGWVSVALPVLAVYQDVALRQLPRLGTARLSYWLRYHTSALGPHLRVRVLTRTAACRTEVLDALAAWAEDLADQRLSNGLLHSEPYLRETQRYGGPDAIESAEAFFAADSARARAALHLDQSARLVLAARSIRTIATVLAPSQAHHAARAAALTAVERRHRDELRAQTGTPIDTAAPVLTPSAHRTALTDLAALLSPEVATAVASDVIHMHCNRLLGLDAGAERVARSLALDLLHRQ